MESEQKTRREGGEEEERLSDSGSRTSIGNSHSEPFQRDERAEAQGHRRRVDRVPGKKRKHWRWKHSLCTSHMNGCDLFARRTARC